MHCSPDQERGLHLQETQEAKAPHTGIRIAHGAGCQHTNHHPISAIPSPIFGMDNRTGCPPTCTQTTAPPWGALTPESPDVWAPQLCVGFPQAIPKPGGDWKHIWPRYVITIALHAHGGQPGDPPLAPPLGHDWLLERDDRRLGKTRVKQEPKEWEERAHLCSADPTPAHCCCCVHTKFL